MLNYLKVNLTLTRILLGLLLGTMSFFSNAETIAPHTELASAKRIPC
jgi:hypothetical protein